MALTEEAIVAAGISILDRYGLGDLSMRRIAEALGVQAGALYYHVPNKQALLAAIADQILGGIPQLDETLPAGEWLNAWAHGLRAALLSHRDGAELVASALASGHGAVDPSAVGIYRLKAAGLANPDLTMTALLHLVLGHVVQEQTQAQMRDFGVLPAEDTSRHVGEEGFEWAVGLLIGGVVSRPGQTR